MARRPTTRRRKVDVEGSPQPAVMAPVKIASPPPPAPTGITAAPIPREVLAAQFSAQAKITANAMTQVHLGIAQDHEKNMILGINLARMTIWQRPMALGRAKAVLESLTHQNEQFVVKIDRNPSGPVVTFSEITPESLRGV